MRVRSSLCPRLVEGFQEGHTQSCRRCALSHRACVCAERVCAHSVGVPTLCVGSAIEKGWLRPGSGVSSGGNQTL